MAKSPSDSSLVHGTAPQVLELVVGSGNEIDEVATPQLLAEMHRSFTPDQLPSDEKETVKIVEELTDSMTRHVDVTSDVAVVEPTGNESLSIAKDPQPAETKQETVLPQKSGVEYVKGRKSAFTLKNVAYTEAKIWNQGLDIYLPHGTAAVQGATNVTMRPVVIHVHGGGWKRGDRQYKFYGAPMLCDAYAGMGLFSVAVGYRLGKHPEFVQDVAKSIAWILENLPRCEGCATADTSRVILSGHSAGAHLTSLLLTDPSYLRAAGVTDFSMFQGALLLSGVFTLRNPFGTDCTGWKNWVFQKAYMKGVFDDSALDAASPSWRIAQLTSKQASAELLKETMPKQKEGDDAVLEETEQTVAPVVLEDPLLNQIPCAVLRAHCDLGLEFDANRFYRLLVEYGRCKRLEFRHIKSTSHASICNSELSYPILAELVATFLVDNETQ